MKKTLILYLTVCLVICGIPCISNAASQNAMWIFGTHLQITNGVNGHSYNSSYPYRKPIDAVGPTSGIDSAVAPFDCKVVKIEASEGNTIAFESLNPVRMADGSEGYVTFMLSHDNDISNMYVGQTFSQGSVIYQEGTKGVASGNHIHIEACKGRYSATGGSVWAFIRAQNRVALPSDIFFLYPNTNVKATGGYTWRYVAVNKPSNASINVNQIKGSSKSSITLTWSAANIESYWLHVYRDGKDFINESRGTGTSLTRTYPVGTYDAYIVGCNSAGESSPAHVQFVISDTKPSNAKINVSQSSATSKDRITLTWSATNQTSYWLHVYKDGKDYINQSMGTSTSLQRTYPVGTYDAYIVGCNAAGDSPAAHVKFVVSDKTQLSVTSDKSAYQVGDKAKFTFNAEGSTSVHLFIYYGSTKYFEGQFPASSSHEYQLIYPGDYTFYIVGHYASSDQTSEKGSLSVSQTNQHVHKLAHEVGLKATCTEPGSKEYWYCADCGKYFFDSAGKNEVTKDSLIIKALGHDYQNGVCGRCGAKDPSYSESDPSNRPNPFVDITINDPYYDAVQWAYYADPQITNGIDATHFGPNQTVTRGQCVAFLWRAMGCPEPKSSFNPFKDVPTNQYYYKPVLWAVENGITKGTSATAFSPNATLSTQHIITFLYRTKNPGEDGWNGEAKSWAADGNGRPFGVNIAVNNNTPCPRANVVQFLQKMQ